MELFTVFVLDCFPDNLYYTYIHYSLYSIHHVCSTRGGMPTTPIPSPSQIFKKYFYLQGLDI